MASNTGETNYETGELSFAQLYPAFARLREYEPKLVDAMEEVVERSRRFRKEYIDPVALRVDRRVMNEPTYVAEEIVQAACKERFFGMMLPKIFGGVGLPLGASMISMEELATGCLGLANLLGVHGLALCTVAATGDLGKMEKLARRLASSEKEGRPALLSTAITEPGAGTDVEDVEFLKTARLCCEATPVKGGYKLNGRKVFISNGSVAHTHVVIMPTNKKNPVQTEWVFLVETGTPGLSIGRVERKMGQKACPAAELIFEDCFIPEENRVGHKTAARRTVDLVLGATRGAVGLWGAAAARSAYQRAYQYARTHKLKGRWLADEQWVQFRLTDMFRNAALARAAFVDATFSNELFGLSSLMQAGKKIPDVSGWIPEGVLGRLPLGKLLDNRRMRRAGRKAIDAIPEKSVDVASSFGAASKVCGTDMGIENCHLAIEIMGADGLRHDRGMEKIYRDAKLLQIYEGTNQLNRIDIYKRSIAPAAA